MTRKKQNIYWRLGLGFLGLLVVLLILRLVLNQLKQSRWDGENRFGWVSQSEKGMAVTMLIPEQKRWLEIQFDPEVAVETAFGFGEYRLAKVFELGQLEAKGGRLLTGSVANYLGLLVEGYRVARVTNLSWWDKARLSFYQWRWREARRVLRIDPHSSLTQRDELIHQELFDPELTQENLNLAVVNATNQSGLAQQIARRLTNVGASVRFLGTVSEQTESQIWLDRQELQGSKTLKAIREQTGITPVRIVDTEKQRSDIVVVLGQDYIKL